MEQKVAQSHFYLPMHIIIIANLATLRMESTRASIGQLDCLCFLSKFPMWVNIQKRKPNFLLAAIVSLSSTNIKDVKTVALAINTCTAIIIFSNFS